MANIVRTGRSTLSTVDGHCDNIFLFCDLLPVEIGRIFVHSQLRCCVCFMANGIKTSTVICLAI